MILKNLNDKLGPKTITAEGQIQEIGKIVKRETGLTYTTVSKKKTLPKGKKKRILPRRKNVDEMKETYYPNKHILK